MLPLSNTILYTEERRKNLILIYFELIIFMLQMFLQLFFYRQKNIRLHKVFFLFFLQLMKGNIFCFEMQYRFNTQLMQIHLLLCCVIYKAVQTEYSSHSVCCRLHRIVKQMCM